MFLPNATTRLSVVESDISYAISQTPVLHALDPSYVLYHRCVYTSHCKFRYRVELHM